MKKENNSNSDEAKLDQEKADLESKSCNYKAPKLQNYGSIKDLTKAGGSSMGEFGNNMMT